jgi:formylglycine-generating enzyme required for sulfatase activity
MQNFCSTKWPRLVFLAFLGVLLFTTQCAKTPTAWPLWDGRESTAEYAKRVNLSPTKTLDLGKGVKLETVLIPAGKFMMGSPDRENPLVGQFMLGISGFVLLVLIVNIFFRAWKKRTRPQYSLAYLILMSWVAAFAVWGGVRWHEALKADYTYANEHPAHLVTLPRPFYMGKYPVTFEQYFQLENEEYGKGDNAPAQCRSWDEAQEFCKKASQTASAPMRLPTEAEWEYACRAGTEIMYKAERDETDNPMDQKEPNKFGLYGMYGYWQWCQDWYGAYKSEAQVDPQGPVKGSYRVIRGGNFAFNPRDCRSAYRGDNHGSDYVCFRVVVPVAKTP